MKLGMIVRMGDGRIGTVVFNGLVGVGIKWGRHYPDPAEFANTIGDLGRLGVKEAELSEEFEREWRAEALLREPWDGCERSGFAREQCVGSKFMVEEVPE